MAAGQVDIRSNMTRAASGAVLSAAEVDLPGSCRSMDMAHLDTCQSKTYLHARVPRIDCPVHGFLQVTVP